RFINSRTLQDFPLTGPLRQSRFCSFGVQGRRNPIIDLPNGRSQRRRAMSASDGGLISVKRELKELQLLLEISQILDRSMDLREVVGPVLEALARHMEMVRGTLALVNRETGEISIDAAHGLSESQKEKGRYRLGEGV